MELRDKLLIYTFAQFNHNKPLRRAYRVSHPQLQVLLALYYTTKLKPPQRGVKAQLRKLVTQFNKEYIETCLVVLKARGLIVYEKTDRKHLYTLEVSKEGLSLIEEYYSEEVIGEFMDKY